MFTLFGDKIIWWVSILFFVTSILLVYSSGGTTTLISHITHLIMGLGLIFIFSRFNYKYFTNLSTILVVISSLMLLILIILPSYKGAIISTIKGRWISFGMFSFQPSELAKYSLVIFLCRNLVLYKEQLIYFKSLALYILLPTALICFLIMPFNLSTVSILV